MRISHEKTHHPIFHPLNSTLIFDQYVKISDISTAKVIILCGSRLAPTTVGVIIDSIKRSVKAFIPEYFADRFEGHSELNAKIKIFNNFRSIDFDESITPFLGCKDEWRIRFKSKYLVITNPEHEGKILNIKMYR